MMSLEAIRALNQETAEEAIADDRTPVVPTAKDIGLWRNSMSVKIPNLGGRRPDGWVITESDMWFFVDKAGMGTADEPALTVLQFLDQLEEYSTAHPAHGYAIVEEGQFQLYVAPFERIRNADSS